MKHPSRKFAILTFAVIVATTFVFIGRFKTKLPTAQPQKRHIVKLDFIGANPNPKGEAPTEATFNYFKGQPEQWKTGLKTYAKSIYEALWSGIDLEDSGTANWLKYPFPVKLGAYQTTYSGLTLNESFVTKLHATGNALVYSTYLGSGQGGNDTARSLAVDSIGNAYVTGPGCALCPILNSAVNSVGQGAPSNSATATPAATLLAQFSQRGPKLVGTGAVGNAAQGSPPTATRSSSEAAMQRNPTIEYNEPLAFQNEVLNNVDVSF